MDCSLPGFSVHGNSQTRILERVTISSSGSLPDPRIKLMSSASPALAGRFYISEPPGKPYVQLHFSYILTECKRTGMMLYITQLVWVKYNKGIWNSIAPLRQVTPKSRMTGLRDIQEKYGSIKRMKLSKFLENWMGTPFMHDCLWDCEHMNICLMCLT